MQVDFVDIIDIRIINKSIRPGCEYNEPSGQTATSRYSTMKYSWYKVMSTELEIFSIHLQQSQLKPHKTSVTDSGGVFSDKWILMFSSVLA